MTIDDLATQFVEDLAFNTLLVWADILSVDDGEGYWFDDEWPDKEANLRVAVAEAMANLGRAK